MGPSTEGTANRRWESVGWGRRQLFIRQKVIQCKEDFSYIHKYEPLDGIAKSSGGSILRIFFQTEQTQVIW